MRRAAFLFVLLLDGCQPSRPADWRPWWQVDAFSSTWFDVVQTGEMPVSSDPVEAPIKSDDDFARVLPAPGSDSMAYYYPARPNVSFKNNWGAMISTGAVPHSGFSVMVLAVENTDQAMVVRYAVVEKSGSATIVNSYALVRFSASPAWWLPIRFERLRPKSYYGIPVSESDVEVGPSPTATVL